MAVTRTVDYWHLMIVALDDSWTRGSAFSPCATGGCSLEGVASDAFMLMPTEFSQATLKVSKTGDDSNIT